MFVLILSRTAKTPSIFNTKQACIFCIFIHVSKIIFICDFFNAAAPICGIISYGKVLFVRARKAAEHFCGDHAT